MPRKFLGNKLDRNLDFVRPASLDVTSFDLNNLPDLPDWSSKEFVESENFLNTGNDGRRISRAFGGTVKLKKRLSSVPELLMHRAGRLEQKEAENKDSNRAFPIPKPAITKSSQQKIPVNNHQVPKDVKSADQKKILARPVVPKRASRTHASSPLAGPPIMGHHTSVMAFPAIASTSMNMRHSRSRSIGEVLFDEILTAYGALPEDQKSKSRTVVRKSYEHPVNRQLKAAFSASKKQSTAFFDPVIRVEDNDQQGIAQLGDVGNAEPVIEESLPSPCYFNSSGSDPSSSGEEFSDIGSIISSLKTPRSVKTHEGDDESAAEAYFSADDNLTSPGKVSVASSLKIQQPLSRCSLRHVRTSQVNPIIFTLDDDLSEDCGGSDEEHQDRCITDLQEELTDLEIADTSSSIYNE
ncbi:LAFA_0B04852g1_1 [Lachancea sp. 'fantastica']|nr:LAFA_0B04852g1_1 [Lachancea sp. 'fantastica']